MIGILLNILILLVIAVVVFLAVRYLCDQAEFDPPLRKIILLIVGLIFLILLINLLAGNPMRIPVVVV